MKATPSATLDTSTAAPHREPFKKQFLMRFGLVVFWLLAGLGAPEALVGEGTERNGTAFFVAPSGDDSFPGTRTEPFATLERARAAVRALGPDVHGDILVEVAPGDYFLGEPFLLEPQDSGRNGFRVIYRGAGEPGSARLLGGRRVLEWEPVDGRIFRAKVNPDRPFHTLYENGIRARRARFPSHELDPRFPLSDAPYLTAGDGDGRSLIWRKGDLDPIAQMDLGHTANLVVWPWGYCDWAKRPCRILGVQPAMRRIEIMDINEAVTTHHKVSIGAQARYYVEGALGLLNAPGEFHLDAVEGLLYYWPRFGHPSEQEIIAPHLHRIVSLEGEGNDLPVQAVTWEGFTLAFTDTFPYLAGNTFWPWSETSSGPHGIVHLRYTRDVEVRFNHVKGSGMNGIYLERSNQSNLIYGNWIQDCGVSGIVLAYHRQARQFPEDRNSGNRMVNNLIHGLGSIATDTAGINIWGGSDNIVRHCEIFDGVRYGVSIRGPYAQLNAEQYDAPIRHTNRPVSEGNRIEYTHLYRLAQDSGDTAAMHMAGISSRTHHPVNYLKQLLIEDIAAHPSVKDMPPEGIYFDYTIGVTDQVLRDIEIRRVPNPFRTNRTDVRHTYDNVSWLPGFDPSRMAYDRIGLTDDFPSSFRAPSEVVHPVVQAQDRAGTRWLTVSWEPPAGEAPVEVMITAEGVQGAAPVRVPAGRTSVAFERPAALHPFMLRLQTAGRNGHRSSGILIPAAEPPQPVTQIEAQGTDGGIDLSWRHPAPDAVRFRVALVDTGRPAWTVPENQSSLRIPELENDRTYTLRIDTEDADGYIWRGTEFRATAGRRIPVPTDAVAGWTYEGESLVTGNRIPYRIGQGPAWIFGAEGVTPDTGLFGKSLHVQPPGYLLAEEDDRLAIGAGDYALSLWIRRAASTHMTGRIFAHGGGTRGVWEHWGAEWEEDTDLSGFNLSSNDFQLNALLHDGINSYDLRSGGLDLTDRWNHVVVNIKRDKSMTLWFNGNPIRSIDISSSAGRDIRPAMPLRIGKHSGLEHRDLYWTGSIDRLLIFQRALTAAEIAALYAERKSVGEGGDTRLARGYSDREPK